MTRKHGVADWLVALRIAFPLTPVIACHRQYNYVPGLLPFPVITLQKVEAAQARAYIHAYLREQVVPDHMQVAEQLGKLLLDDPEYAQVRDLAQTPLFLWMIVERYREKQVLPRSRGELFDTFTRWYLEERYHTAHAEHVAAHYPYEDKAALLGALGHEMVQRRATELPEAEVSALVPSELCDRWAAVLEEIIAAQMLERVMPNELARKRVPAEGQSRPAQNLRFLHQSFQEYFAARQFLKDFAAERDPEAIRQKVSEFAWHDTFAVLLGFVGDEPEVVTRIIEEALKINPILTARCLRVAEFPDARLVEQFVNSQEARLLDAEAGKFAPRACRPSPGRARSGAARAALWRVADAATAPEKARVEAIQQLAQMPGQVRFENEAGQIKTELTQHLTKVFDEAAPEAVQLAAVEAIATARLTELSAYLTDLLMGEAWPLRRAAWKACQTLALKLTPRQQAAYTAACQARLAKTEQDLYQESVDKRMDELNAERVEILRQIASPDNLPLLLTRRFGYHIRDDVRRIVEDVARMTGRPPAEAAGRVGRAHRAAAYQTDFSRFPKSFSFSGFRHYQSRKRRQRNIGCALR